MGAFSRGTHDTRGTFTSDAGTKELERAFIARQRAKALLLYAKDARENAQELVEQAHRVRARSRQLRRHQPHAQPVFFAVPRDTL